MKKTLTTYFIKLLQQILFWVIAMQLYSIYRYTGLGTELKIEFLAHYETSSMFFFYLMNGAMIGFLYANLEFFFNRYLFQKMPLAIKLIAQSCTYLILTVLTFKLILEISSLIFEINVNNDRGWWQEDLAFWAILTYLFVTSFTLSFIRISVEKFGRSIFLNTLIGKYKTPKEEDRIFMFLDLKSSTTIAEQLGHYQYSQFVQDCFYDLNELVRKFEAEIYQYVGDEAVLVWKFEKGIRNNNCIDLFFAFDQQLKSKANYYNDKYDTIPEFKAGVHGGKLMVAEVGTVKKELAYHGDVINSTARIQALCNQYRQKLIISLTVFNQLTNQDDYERFRLGELPLKGKQAKLGLIGIDKH